MLGGYTSHVRCLKISYLKSREYPISMINLSYDKRTIIDLVKRAYEGRLVLPDFQRDFVWTRQDIEELIKSLLENVFIGVLLIQKIDNPENPPFKVTTVKGVPPEKMHPEELILDGQQRITSLFYALYSPDYPLRNSSYPYAFFIDLEKLAKDDIENAVFSISKNSREFKSLLDKNGNFNTEELRKRKWLPLTFLMDSPRRLNKYLESVFDSEEIIDKIWNYLEKKILEYQVHVFYLHRANPEDVIILFERLNKTGIRLSTYDLLVARMYKFIKLKEKWKEALSNNLYIARLAENNEENTKIPYMIIQAIVLSKGFGIKSRELMKIDERVLNEEEWDRAVDIFENKVLRMVFDRSKYGIIEPKWIPYFPTITIILALFLKYSYPPEEKIDRWYWASIFSERYSGSTETVMKQDFEQLCKWFEDDNTVPDVIEELKNQLRSETLGLMKVRRFSNAKYKGVFNLLFKEDVRDFFHIETSISYDIRELEDHHIFPRAFLKEKGINDERIDCVLNRTLILGSTNRRISKKSPSEYIEEIIKGICQRRKISKEEAEEETRRTFKKHFINDEMFDILRDTSQKTDKTKVRGNFETFLELREREIINKIKEYVGIL